ncbi:MAG: TIGR04053 family radical SAM/SPASM domain-containing protein [Planctomycetes bacterium]|nr:TIGR04053 family radical SAM/SPASM domain-containing protein [Planctomycetota bacterium]
MNAGGNGKGSRGGEVPACPDFALAPFLLIWEVTRACALACRHCRADAIDRRDPRELSTEEGRQLLTQAARMGTPIVVLTGGDPLQRDDLEDLIRHAKGVGLRVGTIPAATERLTVARVRSLKDAGLDQMAVSIDGATSDSHDLFRQVEGTYDRALAGAAYAREAALPLQVNTVFGAWNLDEFDEIAARVRSLGAVFWEVFLLVPTGRGAQLQGPTARQCEDLFAKLYAVARTAPFLVKITEAPHYRRYVIERMREAPDRTGPRARDLLARPSGPGGSIGMAPHAVNAGKGFCFVDHVGDVYPSGFLPLSAGNVRARPLAGIYREAPLFRMLRDPSLLKGWCGRCNYRDVCGGSRSRAYALSYDAFAEDPWCLHEPA